MFGILTTLSCFICAFFGYGTRIVVLEVTHVMDGYPASDYTEGTLFLPNICGDILEDLLMYEKVKLNTS
jgi:hypothetical protein